MVKTVNNQENKEIRMAKRPKSYSVQYNYNSNTSSENYNKHLEKILEKGEIPNVLTEGSRLVEKGNSEQADIVIGYIYGIMNKLSLASTGKKMPDLKIVLSEQEGINTGIITKANPPILIVGLGLIDLINERGFGEDHLAAVLGHERFHWMCHRQWADLENGRAQESSGDVYGVIEASDAGYSPLAMGEFFKSLKKDELGNLETVLYGLMDEHPSLDNRIRNTDLAIAQMQLTKNITNTQIKIPENILKAADVVKYKSVFEQYKTKQNFDTASPKKQLKLIADYFRIELDKKEYKTQSKFQKKIKEIEGPPESEMERFKKTLSGADLEGHIWVTKHNSETDCQLMSQRLYEAFEALQNLQGKKDIKKKATAELFNFMKSDYSGKDRDTDAHYFWVLSQLSDFLSDEPVNERHYKDYHGAYYMGEGRGSTDYRINEMKQSLPSVLLKLEKHAKEFWEAEIQEDAVKAGNKFEVSSTFLNKYYNGVRALKLFPKPLDWPKREKIREQLKNNETVRLPWENHIQWTDNAHKDNADVNLIKRVAYSLDCDDPRLTGREASSYRFGEDLEFSHFQFADNGGIVDLTITKKEEQEKYQKTLKPDTASELFENEYQRQKDRKEAEDALVIKTDWSEMEQDFWGFIKNHETELEPAYSIVPETFPFAEEFMKRLQNLVQEKPELWQDTYITFLTGFKPDVDDYKKYREYELKELQDFSFPYLLKENEEKYFGYGRCFDKFRQSFTGIRGSLPVEHPMSEILAQYSDMRRIETDFRLNKKTGLNEEYNIYPPKVEAAEEQVEISFGIDHSHPYIQAILDLDASDLPYARKIDMTSHFRYFNDNATSVDGYYNISPNRLLDYSEMNTSQSFARIEKKSQDMQGHTDNTGIWNRVESVELLESLKRLEGKKPDRRFSISQFDYFTITEDFKGCFYFDKNTAKELQKELKSLINKQLSRNRRIDFKAKLPIKVLIGRFVKDHGLNEDKYRSREHNVFAFRPRLEKSYQKHIKNRIMAQPTEDRIPYLEQLMELQLKDPQYRDWAIKTWVEATAIKLGKDDNSLEYAKEFKRLTKKVVKQLNSTQGIGCITKLLEEVEAQREISLSTKKIITENYGRTLLEQDASMRIIESAVDTCAHDSELRQAFLQYITEPLTTSGTKKFTKLVKSKVANQYTNSEFVKQFYDPKERFSVAPLQERTIVDYLHQNFWSAPFELRTVYLDRILFPVRDDTEDGFNEAVTFVLDKVLPKDRTLASEAREALLVYLDCCPPELRRVTFSAILATTEESASKEGELRPGQVLSYVLGRTGAAGGQLLQAAHSYLMSQDIEDADIIQFRDDLESSKIDFSKPFRWEVFERMDEVLNKGLLQEIYVGHVGPVLGSGSTAYVVACDKEDGETACKLMRKDVVSIADLQFGRYYEAFTRLANDNKDYEPLPSMVDSARKLMSVAANGFIGEKQIEYAKKSYDPITVKVNGVIHKFNVAAVISAGAEYIETERIYGQHLNDMSSGTDKMLNSIAIEAAEEYRQMQGLAIDEDRHGGQQGIKDNVIGMFDVNQIPFDVDNNCVIEPSSKEKYALGCVIGKTINGALTDKSAVQAFIGAITDNDWGEEKSYLVGEQRSLLARMDVHAGLGSNEKERALKLAGIFNAVCSNKRIDRNIICGLADTLSLKACVEMIKHALKAKKSEIKVEIIDKTSLRKTEEIKMSEIANIAVKSAAKRTLKNLF